MPSAISPFIAQNPSLEIMLSRPSLEEAPKNSGFADMLSDSISSVNKMMQESAEKETALVTGKSENIHDAMISMDKAETSMKLMMQFRNKAIDAYQEILRMPL